MMVAVVFVGVLAAVALAVSVFAMFYTYGVQTQLMREISSLRKGGMEEIEELRDAFAELQGSSQRAVTSIRDFFRSKEQVEQMRRDQERIKAQEQWGAGPRKV